MLTATDDPSFPVADAALWFPEPAPERVRFFPGDHGFLSLQKRPVCAQIEQDVSG